MKLELFRRVRVSTGKEKGCCTELTNVGFSDKVLVPGLKSKSRVSASVATLGKGPQLRLPPTPNPPAS